MTSELTKEQKDQFEKLFYSFDTDKDGESKLSAINEWTKKQVWVIALKNQLMKRCLAHISIELLGLWYFWMKTNCQKYPRKGQITTVELNTVMKSLGLDSTEDDLKAMIGIVWNWDFEQNFPNL